MPLLAFSVGYYAMLFFVLLAGRLKIIVRCLKVVVRDLKVAPAASAFDTNVFVIRSVSQHSITCTAT